MYQACGLDHPTSPPTTTPPPHTTSAEQIIGGMKIMIMIIKTKTWWQVKNRLVWWSLLNTCFLSLSLAFFFFLRGFGRHETLYQSLLNFSLKDLFKIGFDAHWYRHTSHIWNVVNLSKFIVRSMSIAPLKIRCILQLKRTFVLNKSFIARIISKSLHWGNQTNEAVTSNDKYE